MNWSMMPHGIPANVCSAFWQTSIFSNAGAFRFSSASRNVWVATSREAELETPPPMGTDEAITASKPVTTPEDIPRKLSYIQLLLKKKRIANNFSCGHRNSSIIWTGILIFHVVLWFGQQNGSDVKFTLIYKAQRYIQARTYKRVHVQRALL